MQVYLRLLTHIHSSVPRHIPNTEHPILPPIPRPIPVPLLCLFTHIPMCLYAGRYTCTLTWTCSCTCSTRHRHWHINMSINMYTYICIYMYLLLHTCSWVCIHICTDRGLAARMYIHIYIYTHAHIYTHALSLSLSLIRCCERPRSLSAHYQAGRAASAL